MIAMALACRPKLLIADEPTTALDVTLQVQILDLLDQLQRETKMAVLFITHDLNLVRRFSQRVGVMERGVLVESGPTERVFARPQHPYTQRLIDSRPRGRAPAVDPAAATLLRAADIEVSFRRRRGGLRPGAPLRAVHGVGLELRRGETVGIVGESGSGKTTLGMALLALQRINAGRIELGSLRLDRASGAALRGARRRIQVVFQDPFASLSPRLTVEQIVGEGLQVHFPQLDAGQRRERAAQTLAEVGLAEAGGELDVLSRYPHEFSGGQRQRIAIARAVVIRPEILILDEPTSSLDVTIQQQILALLRDLQSRHGMSYLFISHDLEVVRAMSQRILVMKDGEVVEQGSPEAIFERPVHPYTKTLLAAFGGIGDGGGR
jgi:microcin C transport system ATP-binding protein